MADKPKFIPAETQYGFGKGMAKALVASESSRVYLNPEENRRAHEEAGRKIAEMQQAGQLEPTKRMGEQLTQSDKDELAKLRQQMERGGKRDVSVAGESAGDATLRDLEEKAENTRFEADQAYNARN